jgi:hypothetical protein
MATSSRQSAIFGVNDWKAIYKTYSQANFRSYDYETLRKSFVDYLRLYYPETFNDYVESSEYIALLDIVAFMGQAVAFRDDLNTRENFIDTAERRDSVIKLANLVNYNPKRNNAAQGFLKITSISTTENVTDINGFNLAGIPVFFNDPANPNWQEQFNSIINACLITTQRIGRPGNTQEIANIKTEEYSIKIPTTVSPVIPFAATVGGVTMNFECVSVTSLNENYLYEIPPNPKGTFNILYRNDKFGFGSANTGFFLYFKQGSLTNYDFSLSQQIANQVIPIGDIQGINETDTWLYKIDPVTGELLNWIQVDNLFANTYLRTENSRKAVFSVTSRFNDQVNYVFGDGVFSEIPVGSFRSLVRTSNALQYTIDPVEIQGITLNFSYISKKNKTETLTLTVTLTNPVNNAQSRESIANIKAKAPIHFYSQNRMVNGEDYNNFPYTLFSSIIKTKALNISSIGVSRNFDLLDPTGKYSNTTSFSEDGVLYLESTDKFYDFNASEISGSVSRLLSNQILEILSNNNLYQYYVLTANRYTVDVASGDGVTTWQQTNFDGTLVTGYFYNSTGPVNVGIYSAYNMKYCTPGALLKFIAPTGYYFKNNRLVAGIAPSVNNTFMWVNVLNVVEDGSNGGAGNLYNGSGPITLSKYVPTGAVLTTIIPVFENTLTNATIQNILDYLANLQNFSLYYVNNLPINVNRWFIGDINRSDALIKFNSLGSGAYRITSKAITYYFGSVKNTRFIFSNDRIIYDPFSGNVAADNVKVIKTNLSSNGVSILGEDFKLSVTGQVIEADGYPDNYSVEIGCFDANNPNYIDNPDFFETITGYVYGSTNTSNFVFIETYTDANNLTKKSITEPELINYNYAFKTNIEAIKYEYPVGQIFYAYSENKFYKSVQNASTLNILNLEEVTQYTSLTGRQSISFQYQHLSNNTTRIDPGTTNIIDLYIVTLGYYNSYINWIQDTTGLINEPPKPTIEELSQDYNKLNDYKMMSDTVVLNSVTFKPLFGNRAIPELRATIKVIKSSNTTASDSEIRSAVLTAMNDYFTIDNWDFGDTFYFSELSAYLHSNLEGLISSAILVPKDPSLTFGDLYEIRCAPYEIFVNGAQASDIVIISAITPEQLQPN